jgi:phosphoribosylformylglycinamidine cyclo-ligase
VVNPETLDLSGASIGMIRPKSRFMSESKIVEGDIIYGLSSSGIHANGLSKARKIAEKTPDGFFTKLSDGQTLGEALLVPTKIYARPVMDMLDSEVDIHYMQPITGHAFEKIARARRPFTYRITELPKPSLLFEELIRLGGENGFDVSSKENYFVWNMGVGWTLTAPKSEEEVIASIAKRHELEAWPIGIVEKGPRRVVMPFKDKDKEVEYVP